MKQLMTFLFLLFLSPVAIMAQNGALEKSELKNWHLQEYTDSVRGTNIQKAYSTILKGKMPKEKIIVAVIDSGIDTQHEDLKGKIWVNEDEIAQNYLDDDNNGYVDDVKGWNFLGNADGSMVGKDNLEVTRIYKKLSHKWEGKTASEIKDGNIEEWKFYQRVKNEFEEGKMKAEKAAERYNRFHQMYTTADTILMNTLGENYTKEQLDTLQSSNPGIMQSKALMLNLFNNNFEEQDLDDWGEYVNTQLNWHYNPDVDVRSEIIKDDPNNLYETGYGNNKVDGVEPNHGTHVAGIIAAIRNNDLGINGIADYVKIMPIRTVPGGDEHDKDVANAIRYAVDNGARVINMSFGKSYSPNEQLVADAIQYAEDNNVLLVHAAGNDGSDVDENRNFPTNHSEFIRGKVKTYLTVGASSIHANKSFPADFTNYGDETVDIFAPGVDIYSTYPNNKYHFSSGTSMAAPVVSGVAALILSYYPDLDAKDIKMILDKTATDLSETMVYLPGSGGVDEFGNELPKKVVEFEELSKTAGLLNAYEAIKMAEKKSKY